MRTKVLYEDLDKIEKFWKNAMPVLWDTDENNQPMWCPLISFKISASICIPFQNGKLTSCERTTRCVSFSTDHQLGWQHPDVACSYLYAIAVFRLSGT